MYTRRQLRDAVFLDTAWSLSRLSHAQRSKVGALLVKQGRIISIGYNGTPPGSDNVCEVLDTTTGQLVTKPEVIHAEQNCLNFAARVGTTPVEGSTLYLTLSPCIHCVPSIIASGIARVVYCQPYRDLSPLNILRNHGVAVSHVPVDELKRLLDEFPVTSGVYGSRLPDEDG